MIIVATCCSCKNLDTKKKVDGACSGAKYNCKKIKNYVSGDTDACDKYEKAYRSNDECDKIFLEGKNWDNDKHTAKFYLIIAAKFPSAPQFLRPSMSYHNKPHRAP